MGLRLGGSGPWDQLEGLGPWGLWPDGLEAWVHGPMSPGPMGPLFASCALSPFYGRAVALFSPSWHWSLCMVYCAYLRGVACS